MVIVVVKVVEMVMVAGVIEKIIVIRLNVMVIGMKGLSEVYILNTVPAPAEVS